MKANCADCYYSGHYIYSEHLASCDCPDITEPTVTHFDRMFKKERQCVHRDNWDDECECECFIPQLSECNGDCEFEETVIFSASFDCPFCGSEIEVDDIGIEENIITECPECGRKIAVHGPSD